MTINTLVQTLKVIVDGQIIPIFVESWNFRVERNLEIIKLTPSLYWGANRSPGNLREMHESILPGNHSD